MCVCVIQQMGIRQSLDFQTQNADIDDGASVDSLDEFDDNTPADNDDTEPTTETHTKPDTDDTRETTSPIDKVTAIIGMRNDEERKALRRTLAKSGASRIAYSGSGTIPVFGVNPDRLPRNRVIPIVKIDARDVRTVKRTKATSPQRGFKRDTKTTTATQGTVAQQVRS